MCGIAGVRKFGDNPITEEEIITLLCAIEHRGPHATGVALMGTSGEITVCKAPEPAWKFTHGELLSGFLTEHLSDDTQIALLHTRFATGGNPEVNENNHPMFDGTTAIIHNGVINNDGPLFQSDKEYVRSCETDSDIIRAIVAKHGLDNEGIRELNKVRGSAAIAAIKTEEPGKLLLARSGSPIAFGYTQNADKMYWASEIQAITKAARPFRQVRGTFVQDSRNNIFVGTMPDNTAWLFDEEGLVSPHHEFKTLLSSYITPNYSAMRSSYASKKRRWKEERKRERAQHKALLQIATVAKPKVEKGALIVCPSCGVLLVNESGAAWTELTCPDCKCQIQES